MPYFCRPYAWMRSRAGPPVLPVRPASTQAAKATGPVVQWIE
jgi:hypothetical protein